MFCSDSALRIHAAELSLPSLSTLTYNPSRCSFIQELLKNAGDLDGESLVVVVLTDLVSLAEFCKASPNTAVPPNA